MGAPVPNVNPNRPTSREEALAARIREEREHRGWSLAEVARRMTEAGCPMDRSAVFRVEQGKPRRRITVDEAWTFGYVFGLPLSEMFERRTDDDWMTRVRTHYEKAKQGSEVAVAELELRIAELKAELAAGRSARFSEAARAEQARLAAFHAAVADHPRRADVLLT